MTSNFRTFGLAAAFGALLAGGTWGALFASGADTHDYPKGTLKPSDLPARVPPLAMGASSWWTDTDGVAEETPGCHIEWEPQGGNNCGKLVPGRQFGEFCTGNVLTESNPGAGVCHDHKNDLGGPYQVDCSDYCRKKYPETGTTYTAGKCEAATAACGNGLADVASAKCTCTVTKKPVKLQFESIDGPINDTAPLAPTTTAPTTTTTPTPSRAPIGGH